MNGGYRLMSGISALCLLGAPRAGAQLLATRNIMIAPALDTAPDGRLHLFAQPRFSIEAARGWKSTFGEQAWNIRMIGSFQIELGDRKTVLLGVFGHELTSNPYNDLGYNPRGAMWDENAFIARRHTHGTSYLGVMFRCRHELDNKDGYDESLPDSLDAPTARVLGLGGVQLGYTSHDRHARGGWAVRFQTRGELYFHQKDDRSPNARVGADWMDALGSATASVRVSRPLIRGVTAYGRGWAATMLFRPADGLLAKTNARGEIGLRGWNMPAGMDLYLAYERWFDDLSRPIPQKNKAWIAGLRVSAGEHF